MLLLLLLFASATPARLGNHTPRYDAQGILQPWTTWTDAIDREMAWYLKAPTERGYPSFVYMTFMEGDYRPVEQRKSFIPATQNGMGILSYLKYYRWKPQKNPKVLEFARAMGDYLVKESLTPDTGKYPRFTRSTGIRGAFPQPPDAGCQRDGKYEIEPDKGGIAGYALARLAAETGDRRYLDQALANARVLAANMGPGDATRSPWPFRADYRTGEGRGAVSSNMAYILRLFDELTARGYGEFAQPRERLWRWIKEFQIPNAAKDGLLWVQFFEDHEETDNRVAWSPLNMARYLVERKEKLDPDWQADARTLIEFTNRNFTSIDNGIPVCGEQTYDKRPWSGVLSTYGAVLAMYSAATGTNEYKGLAWQALTYVLYGTNLDGCPKDTASRPGRGGWQEDAHTDKIHNYLDALSVFPEWGNR